MYNYYKYKQPWMLQILKKKTDKRKLNMFLNSNSYIFYNKL